MKRFVVMNKKMVSVALSTAITISNVGLVTPVFAETQKVSTQSKGLTKWWQYNEDVPAVNDGLGQTKSITHNGETIEIESVMLNGDFPPEYIMQNTELAWFKLNIKHEEGETYDYTDYVDHIKLKAFDDDGNEIPFSKDDYSVVLGYEMATTDDFHIKFKPLVIGKEVSYRVYIDDVGDKADQSFKYSGYNFKILNNNSKILYRSDILTGQINSNSTITFATNNHTVSYDKTVEVSYESDDGSAVEFYKKVNVGYNEYDYEKTNILSLSQFVDGFDGNIYAKGITPGTGKVTGVFKDEQGNEFDRVVLKYNVRQASNDISFSKVTYKDIPVLPDEDNQYSYTISTSSLTAPYSNIDFYLNQKNAYTSYDSRQVYADRIVENRYILAEDLNTRQDYTFTYVLVDRTQMTALISSANANKTTATSSTDGTNVARDKYWVTANVMTDYTSAITKAENISNKATTTQAELEASMAELNTAITTFNNNKQRGLKASDKAFLSTLITQANTNKSTVVESIDGSDKDDATMWVTTAQMNAYVSEISVAQTVYNNASATQAEIDTATTNLVSAIDTFNSQKKAGTMASAVSKTKLTTSIYSATANKDTTYTSVTGEEVPINNDGVGFEDRVYYFWVTADKKVTYANAIADAQLVANKPNVTTAEITDALTALNNATSTFDSAKSAGKMATEYNLYVLPLRINVAKDQMNEVVASVDGTDIAYDKYWAPAEEIALLQQAIDEAEAVMAKQYPSNVECEEVDEKMSNARNRLAYFRKTGKKALQGEIDTLEELVSSANDSKSNTLISEDGTDVADYKYWVKSEVMTTFEDVLSSAQSVVDAQVYSKNDVATATTQLTEALSTFNKAKKLGIVESNKSELKTLVREANFNKIATNVATSSTNIYEDEYWVTSDTYANYESAIASVQAVIENDTATTQNIADAKTALENATNTFNGLKQKGSLKRTNRYYGLDVVKDENGDSSYVIGENLLEIYEYYYSHNSRYDSKKEVLLSNNVNFNTTAVIKVTGTDVTTEDIQNSMKIKVFDENGTEVSFDQKNVDITFIETYESRDAYKIEIDPINDSKTYTYKLFLDQSGEGNDYVYSGYSVDLAVADYTAYVPGDVVVGSSSKMYAKLETIATISDLTDGARTAEVSFVSDDGASAKFYAYVSGVYQEVNTVPLEYRLDMDTGAPLFQGFVYIDGESVGTGKINVVYKDENGNVVGTASDDVYIRGISNDASLEYVNYKGVKVEADVDNPSNYTIVEPVGTVLNTIYPYIGYKASNSPYASVYGDGDTIVLADRRISPYKVVAEDKVTVNKFTITVLFTSKTALTTAITSANENKDATFVSIDGVDITKDKNWVTSEVLAEYISAINVAKDVADNANSKQTDIDDAIVLLEAATNKFNGEKKVGNKAEETTKAELSTLIVEATSNKNTVKVSVDGSELLPTDLWVSAEVLLAYETAITTAQTTLNKVNLSQSELISAIDTLNNATIVFNDEKKTGNKAVDSAKDELLALISTATANKSTVKVSVDGSELLPTDLWVSAEVLLAYETAIETAKLVLDKENATQEEIDEAESALSEAITVFNNAKQAGKKVDKVVLNNKISEAITLKNDTLVSDNSDNVAPSKYFVLQEVMTALENEIALAQNISQKENATQVEVDTALTDLTNVYLEFSQARTKGSDNMITLLTSEITNSKTVLKTAIVSVDGSDVLENAFWVTEQEWATFNDEITRVENLVTQEELSKSKVNEELSKLSAQRSIYENLRKYGTSTDEVEVDKSALASEVETAIANKTTVVVSADGKEVSKDNYWVTQEVMSDYENAINVANGVVESETATQTDVNNALSALQTATTTFGTAKQVGTKEEVIVVDKTALLAEINVASTNKGTAVVSEDGTNIAKDTYWVTQEVMTNYENAIALAQQVADSQIATQVDVNNALSALTNATTSFNGSKQVGTKEDEVVVVDKSSLNAEINTASANLTTVTVSIDGSDVSKNEYWVILSTKSNYESAIALAQSVAQNPDATQEDVNSALVSLTNATATFNNAKQPGTKEDEVVDLAPELTAIQYSNVSKTTATVSFVSNEAGTYTYSVNGENSLEKELRAGVNTINLTDLVSGTEYNVVITAKDLAGNSSNDSVSFTTVARNSVASVVSPINQIYSSSGGTHLVVVTGTDLIGSGIHLSDGKDNTILPTSLTDTRAEFTVVALKNTSRNTITTKYAVVLDGNNNSLVTQCIVYGATSTSGGGGGGGGGASGGGETTTVPTTETANEEITNTIISAVETNVPALEQVVSKFSEYSKTNDSLINSTAKTVDIFNEGERVSKSDKDVEISYDLSGVEINSNEVKDLVAIRVNEDGTTSYLGGKYDEATGTYIVSTKDLDGTFAVVVADPSLYNQLELKINSTDFSTNREGGQLDAAPVIVNSTAFVPVRAISEGLGADVAYNPLTKTASINLDGKTIEFTTGKEVDGTPAPMIVNNRMLVPIRFVSESFDANVIWNAQEKSIQITK